MLPLPKIHTKSILGGITTSSVRDEGRSSREYKDDLGKMDQRLTSRRPRPAMEAGRPAGKKTRERTEVADKAVQSVHGDSFSAKGSKTTRRARPVSA